MGGNKIKNYYRLDYKIVFVASAEPGQLAGNPSIHSGATIVTFCKLAIPANTSLANPLAAERKANRGHLAGFYDRAGTVKICFGRLKSNQKKKWTPSKKKLAKFKIARLI